MMAFLLEEGDVPWDIVFGRWCWVDVDLSYGLLMSVLGPRLWGIIASLLTLLFENRSFTPLPVSACVMVLYSPSSSSLNA